MSQRDTVIVPYTLRVEQSSERKHAVKVDGALPITNFDGRGSDLLKAFDAFVRDLFLKRMISRGDDHFGSPHDIVRQGRTLSFEMQGGESGRERSVRLGARARVSQLRRDGLLYTGYQVYSAMPANSNVAWVLVEKDGLDTLPSVWRREFVKAFKARYPGFKVTFAQVRNDAIWRLLESGLDDRRVIDVKVQRRSQPSSDEESTRGFPLEVSKSEELVYRMDQGKMTGRQFKRIRRFFTMTKDSNGAVVEIDLADDTRDEFAEGLRIELARDVLEITVKADIDGRQKTVRFSGAREPTESYVIEGLRGTRVSQRAFIADCREHVVDLARLSGVTLVDRWDDGTWDVTAAPISPLEVPVRDPQDNNS